MFLRRISIILAGYAFVAALPAMAQQTPEEKRGEELLQKYCASCHAIGLTGKSPHAEAPPFRILSLKYPVDALQEALAEGILTGHPDMPEYSFEPKDVGAIIAYLESIQTK